MALGLPDIAQLARRGGRPMGPGRMAMAPPPMLGGLGAPGNGGGGYGLDISMLHTPEEAETWVGPPVATPEEEQGILQQFENREFGPKGSPTNPPIGEVPGDLDEQFRNMLLWYFMARKGGGGAGQVQGAAQGGWGG